MSNKVIPNTANRDSTKIRSCNKPNRGTGNNPPSGVAMPIMRQTHPIGKTK